MKERESGNKIKELYCPKCDDMKQAELTKRNNAYNVRGEQVRLIECVYVCRTCGEEIFDEDVDKINLDIAYGKYREKNNLLAPEEIKLVRDKYGLTQKAISVLLKWGEVTFSRYENGAIQDPAHDEVLAFINRPENMMFMFKKNGHLMSEETREALRVRLESLLAEKESHRITLCYENFLTSDKSVNENTGYKEFDLEKIKNLIVHISQVSNGILKTKLNKILWYIDFLYFKKFSTSMSGSKYVRLKYGPVPDNYDDIVNLMIKEGEIEKNEIIYNEEKEIVGEEVAAIKETSSSIFSEDELRVINYVVEEFKDDSSVAISKKSHEEKPYKDTVEHGIISYNSAQGLSLDIED